MFEKRKYWVYLDFCPIWDYVVACGFDLDRCGDRIYFDNISVLC